VSSSYRGKRTNVGNVRDALSSIAIDGYSNYSQIANNLKEKLDKQQFICYT
jgi:hypothetical protein